MMIDISFMRRHKNAPYDYAPGLRDLSCSKRHKTKSSSSSSSSSSSCHAASIDIPDPLSPLLPIVHRFWKIFRSTSCILTELLYVCSSWPSYFCSAIWGVHRSTSLMSLSLLLQQCPACLVPLTWTVFVMGGKWPYSWCFVGCCLHDLFNIVRSIFCVIAVYLFLRQFS